MKKRAIIIAVLLCLCVVVPWVSAATVSPASITIPTNMASTRTLTWTLSMTAPPATATSTEGTFRPQPDYPTFARINTSLTAVFQGEIAVVQETLTIPIAVIKKAQELGYQQFIYYRNFPTVSSGSGYITVHLTSPSAAELNINHIRLYFKNQRAEITVKRREPDLQAFADINFTGKGLLKGYWEVDGRLISYVNKNLVYGKSLTIETPAIPALPTFAEGSHIVKFILQEPEQVITLPKALYYVMPDETLQTVAINQTQPYDQAVLEATSAAFAWQVTTPLAAYLVEFMEGEKGSPIFSAYTIRSEYAIPETAIKQFFTSPQPYFWRVKGFDKNDNLVGESTVRQFRIKSE